MLFGFLRSSVEKDKAVLAYVADNPRCFGRDIAEACRLGRGSVFVRLEQLQAKGLVQSELDTSTPLVPGQLARRVYFLTPGLQYVKAP